MSEVLVGYRSLYHRIMDMDPQIRYVTIIDSHGRLMHGGQKQGMRSHLSPENQRQSLRHALDAWELRSRFSEQIGTGKYAPAEYEKIKRITIPLDEKHLVYITTEVEADHAKIIDNIMGMVKEL